MAGRASSQSVPYVKVYCTVYKRCSGRVLSYLPTVNIANCHGIGVTLVMVSNLISLQEQECL